MSKETNFDPSLTGSHENGLFGIPTEESQALVQILPVPWEVTTSYGRGTAKGPEAILKASPQIDLYDLDFGNAYEKGFFLHKISNKWLKTNNKLKLQALKIRDQLESKGKLTTTLETQRREINKTSKKLNAWVFEFAKAALAKGRVAAVLGGDHSSPEGLILASCEHFDEVGVLHIDAHADLRQAYQGFEHSHASIMYNVMHAKKAPSQLVQVGIRDFCEEEYNLIQEHKNIHCHFDQELKAKLYSGESWKNLCEAIIAPLPKNVHVSFDIDGLDPLLCPGTGTPVPGGLQFGEANFLLKALVESGRRIVSFDLNEVAPTKGSEWDANVGARMLFKLCGWSTQ